MTPESLFERDRPVASRTQFIEYMDRRMVREIARHGKGIRLPVI